MITHSVHIPQVLFLLDDQGAKLVPVSVTCNLFYSIIFDPNVWVLVDNTSIKGLVFPRPRCMLLQAASPGQVKFPNPKTLKIIDYFMDLSSWPRL